MGKITSYSSTSLMSLVTSAGWVKGAATLDGDGWVPG